MEIIKLTLGETEDREICFVEGMFCKNNANFFIFAIANGELSLLVHSDLSLVEFMHSIQEDGATEFNTCDCDLVSWDVESKRTMHQMVELDMESVIAYCMESDMECYQCWHHDGNEGLYEAAESDDGLAFVIAHDLLNLDNFENVRSMAENDEEAGLLIPILEEANFDDEEE